MIRVETLRNKHGYLWLNVASGCQVQEDFVNIDNDILFLLSKFYPAIKFLLRPNHRKTVQKFKAAQRKACFLRHDCRKSLKFPDESVDHILCSHFLEHIYPEEAATIIQDFRRVLRKGGTLHIILPNLDALVEEYTLSKADENAADTLISKMLMSHEKKPSLRYRVLGFLGCQGYQHRWMYNANSMALRLKNNGFRLLESNSNIPSLHVRANDGDSSFHLFAEKG